MNLDEQVAKARGFTWWKVESSDGTYGYSLLNYDATEGPIYPGEVWKQVVESEVERGKTLDEEGFARDVILIGALPFSTSISHAWELVEELIQEGWTFTLDVTNMGCLKEVTSYAKFSKFYTSNRFEDKGKTAPEAICKAYLKVKEQP